MSVRLAALSLTTVLAGCTLFPGDSNETPRSVYLLAPAPGAPVAGVDCGSVQVASGSGASGMRTARMTYMRSPYEIEYFAYSVWADSPSRMLGEAVRGDLYASGAFEAVVSTPAATATDLRLDLADTRLVQHFSAASSTLELAVEARLHAVARPTEIVSRRFTISEPAEPNPEGGVRAANAAAERLLRELREFLFAACVRLTPADATGATSSP